MTQLDTQLDKRMYSATDVAFVLSASKRQVWKWIASGVLPSVKFGGKRWVTNAGLDEFCQHVSEENT